jgi:hypothetical protein
MNSVDHDRSHQFWTFLPKGRFAGTYFVIEKIDIFTTFHRIYVDPNTENYVDSYVMWQPECWLEWPYARSAIVDDWRKSILN